MWVSEKFGSKIGGILTGIPTTVFIGLTFIALTTGNTAAHQAALIIPAMAGVPLVLVYSFMQLLKMRAEVALGLAIGIWFATALLFVRVHISSIAINVAIGITLLALAKVATQNYPHDLKAPASVLRRTYIARAIGAGSVIAGSVIIARLAGPIWGGVFAAFPATFVTTLFVLSNAQGPDFAKAVARQLPLANGSTLSFAIFLSAHHSGRLNSEYNRSSGWVRGLRSFTA